jgi:predicted Holliday junction resolvase-like endonuclease
VDSYPWDSKQFRFLGSPIDGVQFEEDRIILVEFKSSSSQMSERQRKIKDLVEQGKVQFELIRAQ